MWADLGGDTELSTTPAPALKYRQDTLGHWDTECDTRIQAGHVDTLRHWDTVCDTLGRARVLPGKLCNHGVNSDMT